MKKIFLVKKDPEKNGQDNWYVMEGKEFAEFISSEEGQRRKKDFGRLDACGYDDFIVIAECGKSAAVEWKRDRNRQDYLRRYEEEILFAEEEDIRDPGDAEESVLIRVSAEEVRIAVMRLEPMEKLLIEKVYLTDEPVTLTKFAQMIGRDSSYVTRLRKKALGKLKNFLE